MDYAKLNKFAKLYTKKAFDFQALFQDANKDLTNIAQGFPGIVKLHPEVINNTLMYTIEADLWYADDVQKFKRAVLSSVLFDENNTTFNISSQNMQRQTGEAYR